MLFKVDFDTKELEKALSKLSQDVREDIAKSAAVAGGQVIRDEAKLRVPVKSGKLKDSIYVAHSEKDSSDKQKTVTVSWNAKKAPHGHLPEFGYWLVINGKTIRRIPGKSFLGAGFEAVQEKAIKAAQDRIKQKLSELK